jgi:hypothetical protein
VLADRFRTKSGRELTVFPEAIRRRRSVREDRQNLDYLFPVNMPHPDDIVREQAMQRILGMLSAKERHHTGSPLYRRLFL